MSQLVVAATRSAGALVSTVAGQLGRGAARAVSAYAAGQAETLLFGPVRREREGPRLDMLQVQTASEGTAIPVVFGRARLAGEVIWASNFRETIATEAEQSGGKGGRPVETATTSYTYTVSVAIGLCEGPVARIGRVWADGREVSLEGVTWRLYPGDETQLPDPLIEAVEGIGEAPAYRGLAYLVFEELPLAPFGNRIPQFSFEVERPLSPDPGTLEAASRAICLIPGSGEAAYATEPVLVAEAEGVTRIENKHAIAPGTDFIASVRVLTETLPNLKRVALVVSWFGTDLRAGECRIEPGVEDAGKILSGTPWSVSGINRDHAREVSRVDGRPAYGGTPSDASIIAAIRHFQALGVEVTFYPFILMDIPPGNVLPGLDGGAGQPAFPWRGRIATGSLDGTAAARGAIEALFGSAGAGDFSVSGDSVAWQGGNDAGLRRMVLHYANLCAVAGGVEAFLLGSEMRGLTRTRDDAGAFPAVEAFVTLAAEVRAILGPAVKLSYAADWSEYGAWQPDDGSGDVLFPLDQLWADPAIDFIGIDNYLPLSDWRDGHDHLDAMAWRSGHDPAYLAANIEGGEFYDWYYASDGDRLAQVRTQINDTAHGEDWVFRAKDIRGWWGNVHHARPGGTREATPTAWTPASKPVRFTELGCGAVDKGAGQPNVFVDPKSIESGLPWHSRGHRDDLIQRRFIEAHLGFWADPANNPVSPSYGAAMIETDGVYLYAWDARPFPDFPARDSVWTDADNWTLGHWLNGRAGRLPLDRLVSEIAGRAEGLSVDAGDLDGLVTGYVIDRPMSLRAALEPLAGLYRFDVVESGGTLRLVPRGGAPVTSVGPQDVVPGRDGDIAITLAQAGDLPAAVEIAFTDDGAEFGLTVASARLPAAPGGRVIGLDVPVVMESGEAAARAARLLADARILAQGAGFALPPSTLALEPGDALTLDLADGPLVLRINEILDDGVRLVEAVAADQDGQGIAAGASRRRPGESPVIAGPPVVEVLDLPLLDGGEAVVRLAAFSRPWPGAVEVWQLPPDGEPVRDALLPLPARIGRLVADLAPGPLALWDRANTLSLSLSGGTLAAAADGNILAGANRLAVETATGWEIIGFADAALQPDETWQLSRLLRGLDGSAPEATGALAGARVVILDGAVSALTLDPADLGGEAERIAAPAGQGPGSAMAVSRTDAVAGLGLRPRRPVHLKAQAETGGIALSWIRCSRIGGDSWSGEVPLGEEEERYRVRVLSGETILREAETIMPAWLWTMAEIGTDLPAGGPVTFSVAQLSVVYGAGAAAIFELSLAPAA